MNKLILTILLILISIILPFSLNGCLQKDIEKETPSPEKIELKKLSTSSYNLFSNKPIYFLLLGSDSRTEDFKGLSDAIMLVKLDPLQKKLSLVSFPRDSRVYIEGVGNRKINSALWYGGPELSVKTVEQISGVKIDYYLLATFNSFKRIIEHVGGVKLNLDKPLYDRWAGANFDAGDVVMNGEMALAFCRARHIENGDFTRAAHQQDLVEAFYQQKKDEHSLIEIVDKVKLIHDQLETNLKPIESFQLGWLLISLDQFSIEKAVLPGGIRNIGGASYVILDSNKMEKIFGNLRQGISIDDID